tara:strand:- start:11736 stop:13679 length:1944 start_codon:yes stop_codon:yes gene_type:complete
MKLLTKAIIGKLEKTRYDKEKPIPNDAPVLARFFNPSGSGTWSVLEGEKLPNNDWRFFGVVDIGQDKEYGYFNLSQLQDIKGQFGLGIERDRNFKGTRASLDKEYGFKNFTRSKEIQEELKNKKRTIPERSYLVPTPEERNDRVLRDIKDDMKEQIISPEEAQKRIIKRLKELRNDKPVSSKAVTDKSLSKELMKDDAIMKQKKELTNISKADRKAFIQSIDVIKDIESDRLSKDDKYYLSRLRAALKQGIDKTDSLTVGQLEKVNAAAEGLAESGGTQRMSQEGARILLPHAQMLQAENVLVKLKKSPLAKNDKPEDGKTYQLTGSPDDASIERGDSWKQSEVKDSNLGKQLPLMVDGKDPKETNSSTLAGIPVNNKKTPTSIEKLLKRITSWRKSNNLGDNKIDFKDYVLNKAFVDIKADTEIMIKQLRKEKEKKQEAKELITLLQNTLYGKGKNQPKPTPDKKQTKEKDNTVYPYNSVNRLPNFKTKAKGKYPHRVAWLQSNGSWVVVDLNDRTLSTSLNIDNLLKKGDTPASEIKKSLSWNQIDEPRARPYLTFRIIKESTSAPKDINFMSFGKIDIKVNKNGFSTYEKRDPDKHYDRKGEPKTMKYTRSNFKYPRANNRYSMWNSRDKGSKGKLGFKILKRK